MSSFRSGSLRLAVQALQRLCYGARRVDLRMLAGISAARRMVVPDRAGPAQSTSAERFHPRISIRTQRRTRRFRRPVQRHGRSRFEVGIADVEQKIQPIALQNSSREVFQQQDATLNMLKVVGDDTSIADPMLRTLVDPAAPLCDPDQGDSSHARRTKRFFIGRVHSAASSIIGSHRSCRSSQIELATTQGLLRGRMVHAPADVAPDPEYTLMRTAMGRTGRPPWRADVAGRRQLDQRPRPDEGRNQAV